MYEGNDEFTSSHNPPQISISQCRWQTSCKANKNELTFEIKQKPRRRKVQNNYKNDLTAILEIISVDLFKWVKKYKNSHSNVINFLLFVLKSPPPPPPPLSPQHNVGQVELLWKKFSFNTQHCKGGWGSTVSKSKSLRIFSQDWGQFANFLY